MTSIYNNFLIACKQVKLSHIYSERVTANYVSKLQL